MGRGMDWGASELVRLPVDRVLGGLGPTRAVEGFLQAAVWMQGEFSIQVIQVVTVLYPCPHPLHPILFGSLLCGRLFAGRFSQAGVVSALGL